MLNVKKILYLIFLILLSNCGEPSPVDLVSVENSYESNIQIELANSDVDAGVNLFGYDSVGIINPFLRKSTIISVSGVRYTNFGYIQKEGYYYAIFNDKEKPIKVKNGKIIGYKSKNFSSVRFNNYEALQIPNVIHFMDRMMVRDTVLGVKYFAKQKMMGHFGQMQQFPFLSKVNFRVAENKNSFVQFDINTPQEIIGKVSFEGSRTRKNLYLNLEWNPVIEGNIEIVFARFRQNTNDTEPLIKIMGNKIGKIRIPFNRIENFFSNNDGRIIISFICKIEKELNLNLLNDTYIIAQSIHNIKVDLP